MKMIKILAPANLESNIPKASKEDKEQMQRIKKIKIKEMKKYNLKKYN
jgi:hypothetical protein